MRAWGRDDLDVLLAAAAALPAGGPCVDVDDVAFIPPGRMPERLAEAADAPGLSVDLTVRCILDSLAAAYARTVHEAAALAGTTVEVLHVVGGGSQNALVCQLTADAAGLPVVAGPVEATALGNNLVQAMAFGEVGSLAQLRAVVQRATTVRTFEPAGNGAVWDDASGRLGRLLAASPGDVVGERGSR